MRAPGTVIVSVTAVLATAVGAQETPQGAEEDANRIADVVVTAQRREENLQSVPIAVTAASAESLAGANVDSISNVQAISPSINFDMTNSAANSANIRIRGIGTVGNSRAFEGAVGVFIDGVYRTRAGQALQNWLDVDGLQVLRGPQGTLFGKNTSAGAMLINSQAPDLERVSGQIELGYGAYEQELVRGAVNVPLSGNMALRVAGLWANAEGFIEDPNTGKDYNDRHPRAAKAQLLFQPTDELSVRLIADWSEEKSNCCYGQVDAVAGPLQGFINGVLIPQRGLRPASQDFEDYEQVLSNDTRQQVKDTGLVLRADWDVASERSVHSVTAVRNWEISQIGMDADFTGANILTINETFQTEFISQELTYNGTAASVAADYVVGVYYSHEDIDATHQLLWGNQAQQYFDVLLGAMGLPPGTVAAPESLWSNAVMPASGSSYAAFTHWSFQLSDPVKLIAGARYSYDEKQGAFDRLFFTPLPNTPFRVLGVQPGPEYDDRYSDSAVSGTLGAQYQFSPEVMGYLTYSRGYKSGGVNIDNTAAGTVLNNPAEIPGATPLDPKYKSEFIDGYELGLKTGYWNGRARSNLALFYDEMTDLQVAQFLGTQFTIINAPEATVYGAEIENSVALNDFVSLGVDLTWLPEAKFGPAAQLLNLSSREFPQAPELAGNLSLSFDKPVSGDRSVVARLALQYSGSQFTNTSNNLRRGAVTEYDVSIGLKAAHQGWSLNLWCQNCTDERYIVQHFNSPLQGTDSNGYVAAPRTYGATLRWLF